MIYLRFFQRFLSKAVMLCVSIGISILIGKGIIHYAYEHSSLKATANWRYLTNKYKDSCFRIDPYLIYKPVPIQENNHCTEHDRYGFRIIENQQQEGKPVVFLGDSFTWGHGVRLEETIPSLIQEKLTADSFQARVFNAAVPGYGLDQELELLQRTVLLNLKPAVVVLDINENDILDDNEACIYSFNNGILQRQKAFLNTTFMFGKTYELIPSFITELVTYKQLMTLLPDRWTLGCSKNLALDNPYHYNKVTSLIKEFKALSRKFSFKLVVTYIQGQKGYDNSYRTDEKYRGKTDNMIAAIESADEKPIVVSREVVNYSIIAEKAMDKNVLGSSVTNFSTDLFITTDPFPYGEKHMNAHGDSLIADILYPTILSALKDSSDNP